VVEGRPESLPQLVHSGVAQASFDDSDSDEATDGQSHETGRHRRCTPGTDSLNVSVGRSERPVHSPEDGHSVWRSVGTAFPTKSLPTPPLDGRILALRGEGGAYGSIAISARGFQGRRRSLDVR
jgi:hypothetical protein